jgi:hypothetical protein
MKKIIFSIITSLCFQVAFAQTSNELGINLGLSNYLGDLQQADVSFRQQGLAVGIFGKHTLNSMFALRANFNYARLHASDENASKQKYKDRNLSFRSNVVEFGIGGELYALPFDRYNQFNSSRKRYFNWTPYIFSGINLFHFNPKARYNGAWVALQPLNTEGQNSSFSSQPTYSLTQISIPFGIGVKYQFSNQFCMAIEIGARKTFTDYLDDVSGIYPDQAKLKKEKGQSAFDLSYRGGDLPQGAGWDPSFTIRGNPANQDWYMINTISISYKFYK